MEVQILITFNICILKALELPLGRISREIGIIGKLREILLISMSPKQPLKRTESIYLAF